MENDRKTGSITQMIAGIIHDNEIKSKKERAFLESMKMEKVEDKKKSSENMIKIQDSGIISIFEDIIESGLLTYKGEKGENGFVPSYIVFGDSNSSIELKYGYKSGENYGDDNYHSQSDKKITIKIGNYKDKDNLWLQSRVKESGGYSFEEVLINSDNALKLLGNEVAGIKGLIKLKQINPNWVESVEVSRHSL